MPDYVDLILQRQEGLEYAENCSGDCECCDYGYRIYPNSFDDPYYGCVYDDFFKEKTFTRGEVQDMLQRIREKVCRVDIPSPTVPEYVEHHRDCQEIMQLIDDIIKEIYKED